jgi:hypothetical protein
MKGFASWLLRILWFLLMLDVRLGIGMLRFVRNALSIGTLAMESVSLSILTARPTMLKTETVLLVSWGTL